jgi:hypothetical protein
MFQEGFKMMGGLVDLQKALDEWWKDYNHLLGDGSGDSECRQKLHRIIKDFSCFQAEQTAKEQALRKLLEDWPVFPPFASLPDDIPETVLTYCLKTLQLKKSFEKVFDEVFFAKKGSFMGETAKP